MWFERVLVGVMQAGVLESLGLVDGHVSALYLRTGEPEIADRPAANGCDQGNVESAICFQHDSINVKEVGEVDPDLDCYWTAYLI